MYRASIASNDHLFSLSSTEGPSAGYTAEGIGYFDYAAPCSWGLVPLYRLWDIGSGEHFYTASQGEHDSLVASGWRDEGNIGCIATGSVGCGSVPLHRLVQPGGFHMFTVSDAERDALSASGWIVEGDAGWVWTGM